MYEEKEEHKKRVKIKRKKATRKRPVGPSETVYDKLLCQIQSGRCRSVKPAASRGRGTGDGGREGERDGEEDEAEQCIHSRRIPLSSAIIPSTSCFTAAPAIHQTTPNATYAIFTRGGEGRGCGGPRGDGESTGSRTRGGWRGRKGYGMLREVSELEGGGRYTGGLA